MAKAQENTHAAIRARALAAGRNPTVAQVNATFKKNQAHTAAVKAKAETAIRKPAQDMLDASNAHNARPNARAVERANDNASFKRVGSPNAPAATLKNSGVTRATQNKPELTRAAVIARARAAGKRPTTPQVTKTLTASKARAAARTKSSRARSENKRRLL